MFVKKLFNMKITYSQLADDPNYRKLKEPTKSAAKLQDKLIRAQVNNLDRSINREKLLTQVCEVINKYEDKKDDLQLDLSYALDVIEQYSLTLKDLLNIYPCIEIEDHKAVFDKTDDFISHLENKYK
jgi:hypothetical protein